VGAHSHPGSLRMLIFDGNPNTCHTTVESQPPVKPPIAPRTRPGPGIDRNCTPAGCATTTGGPGARPLAGSGVRPPGPSAKRPGSRSPRTGHNDH
jgi:hypothetical protein